MSHTCPECGLEHAVEVEKVADVVETEAVVEATVEIARIEADRDVTLAKVNARVEEGWQEQRIAELEGRLSGMQEMLDRLTPEPEPDPEPVPLVVTPPPEPLIEEPEVQPPPIVEPAVGKKAKGNAFWR